MSLFAEEPGIAHSRCSVICAVLQRELGCDFLVCRGATGEEPKKVETAEKCVGESKMVETADKGVGESIWGDAFLWQTIFDLPPF